MGDHANAPWWWGRDDERFTGPLKTRDEAISEARHDDLERGFYIVQAELHEPLKLSGYFTSEAFVEHAEDCAYDLRDHESDDLIFEVGELAMEDLQLTVRAAIDAWQERHGLIFNPWAFKWQGKSEWFAPEEEEASDA